MPLFAATGATWTRMDFGWGKTEKTHGVYDLERLRPFAFPARSPQNPPDFHSGLRQQTLFAPVSPATPEVARGLRALGAPPPLTHFRGRGVLWEIWNEPNGFLDAQRPTPPITR